MDLRVMPLLAGSACTFEADNATARSMLAPAVSAMAVSSGAGVHLVWTGHVDGSVRVWDSRNALPPLWSRNVCFTHTHTSKLTPSHSAGRYMSVSWVSLIAVVWVHEGAYQGCVRVSLTHVAMARMASLDICQHSCMCGCVGVEARGTEKTVECTCECECVCVCMCVCVNVQMGGGVPITALCVADDAARGTSGEGHVVWMCDAGGHTAAIAWRGTVPTATAAPRDESGEPPASVGLMHMLNGIIPGTSRDMLVIKNSSVQARRPRLHHTQPLTGSEKCKARPCLKPSTCTHPWCLPPCVNKLGTCHGPVCHLVCCTRIDMCVCVCVSSGVL